MIKIKNSLGFFLIIIIFLFIEILWASPNLHPNKKNTSPETVIKINEFINYEKLKMSFPFDTIVHREDSQRPYLKITPVKGDDFLLILRSYHGIPSANHPNLLNLERSFLPDAMYLPSTNFNFIASYKIKKWTAGIMKNGNELTTIIYLIEKDNNFYTIWLVFRKFNPQLENVFQKVDFFTVK